MNKIKHTKIYLSRLTALSLVITCLTISAFAQDDGAATSNFRTGIKVGANFNQFNQPGTTIGFNGGLFATYNSPVKFLELQLEVLYMQQGGAREAYFQDLSFLDGTVTGINYFNRYVTFHNVEVPVIVRATLPSLSGETITPRLLVGFAYGFAVGAMEYSDKHYFGKNGQVTPVSNQRTNVGSNYEQHQFGIIAGFAVDYSLGGKTFTTEVRYRRGLNELNLLNYAILEHSGQLYSSSLSINFAISLFNL